MRNRTCTPAQQNFDFQKIIAVVGVTLLVIKFFAYFLTHSVAILTDALESIVNVIAGFIGLYALYLSAQPADDTHPYGHGKVELISSSIEGTLIIVAGLLIIFESVDRLLHPAGIQDLDVGLILIAFAAFVNFVVGYTAIKRGRKNGSMALEASGKHLCTDTLDSVGIIIGLSAVVIARFLGSDMDWLDPGMALVFGCIIIVTGLRVIWKSMNGVMDKADEKLLTEVLRCLNHNRVEQVIDIHHLRAIRYGMNLHLDIHMTIPRDMTVAEADAIVARFTAAIREKLGDSVDVTLMADPCVSDSCQFCTRDHCYLRMAPFTRCTVWNVNAAIKTEAADADAVALRHIADADDIRVK